LPGKTICICVGVAVSWPLRQHAGDHTEGIKAGICHVVLHWLTEPHTAIHQYSC